MLVLPDYVEKLRRDVRHLRVHTATLARSADHQRDQRNRFEEENERLRKENTTLKKENEKLKEEIEKLTKTNKRYQVALFDHGNFKHPDEQEKKPEGGQKGHANTNRESTEDWAGIPKQRRFATHCGACGHTISRVSSKREKFLLDIVINPNIVKLIVESERQWCRNCHTEVHAKHPQSLPFTEYGINVFMMILLLRFRCHLSLANISAVLTVGYGLPIGKAAIGNLLVAAKRYLTHRYDLLVMEVRKGHIMYNDETGWLVAGQTAWMWIMANEEVTVYWPAESRGHGIFKDMYGDSDAASMHDGYKAYGAVIGEEKEYFCWSHILRFAFEETVIEQEGSDAIRMRDALVFAYYLKRNHPEYSVKQLKQSLTRSLDAILAMPVTSTAMKHIGHRLRTQKQGLVNSMLYTKDGTNNLSERELRGMALARTVSHGSDSFKGMETTAVCASVVRTITRKKDADFFEELSGAFTQGIREKHPQYYHQSFTDT